MASQSETSDALNSGTTNEILHVNDREASVFVATVADQLERDRQQLDAIQARIQESERILALTSENNTALREAEQRVSAAEDSLLVATQHLEVLKTQDRDLAKQLEGLVAGVVEAAQGDDAPGAQVDSSSVRAQVSIENVTLTPGGEPSPATSERIEEAEHVLSAQDYAPSVHAVRRQATKARQRIIQAHECMLAGRSPTSARSRGSQGRSSAFKTVQGQDIKPGNEYLFACIRDQVELWDNVQDYPHRLRTFKAKYAILTQECAPVKYVPAVFKKYAKRLRALKRIDFDA